MRRFGRHVVALYLRPSYLIGNFALQLRMPSCCFIRRIFEQCIHVTFIFQETQYNNFFAKVKFFIDYLVSFDVLVNIW